MTRTRAATSGVWGPELAVATPVAPFSLSWVSVGLDGGGQRDCALDGDRLHVGDDESVQQAPVDCNASRGIQLWLER